MRIFWSPQAEAELNEIRAYIARDSRQNAKRMVSRIKRAVAGVCRFPEGAAMAAEFDNPSLREIFVGSYRIIFRITSKCIDVVTVIHGARRLRLPPDPS